MNIWDLLTIEEFNEFQRILCNDKKYDYLDFLYIVTCLEKAIKNLHL